MGFAPLGGMFTQQLEKVRQIIDWYVPQCRQQPDLGREAKCAERSVLEFLSNQPRSTASRAASKDSLTSPSFSLLLNSVSLTFPARLNRHIHSHCDGTRIWTSLGSNHPADPSCRKSSGDALQTGSQLELLERCHPALPLKANSFKKLFELLALFQLLCILLLFAVVPRCPHSTSCCTWRLSQRDDEGDKQPQKTLYIGGRRVWC